MQSGLNYAASMTRPSLSTRNAVSNHRLSPCNSQTSLAHKTLLASSVSSAKGQFSTVVGSLRWVLINGLRLGLMFWYTKVPMFWIPRGWLPGTIEWVMAFPKAPTGGVSIQVWSLACASVISFVAEALTAVYALWIESVPAGKDRQTHTPYSGAAQPSTDQRASEKKSS